MPKTIQIDAQAKKRLILAFSLVTVTFILLFLLILPYRFYLRDVTEARKEAKEVSNLVKIGILSTMMATGESKEIRKVIDAYKDVYDFRFRLIRSDFVEKQHGVVEDMQATDEVIRQVLKSGKGKEDWLDDTTFRYITPYISDQRCQECHEDLEGKKIPTGMVLGVSEIVFDLKGMKLSSLRFIAEISAAVISCLLTMGVGLYFVVKKGILEPLEEKNQS